MRAGGVITCDRCDVQIEHTPGEVFQGLVLVMPTREDGVPLEPVLPEAFRNRPIDLCTLHRTDFQNFMLLGEGTIGELHTELAGATQQIAAQEETIRHLRAELAQVQALTEPEVFSVGKGHL